MSEPGRSDVGFRGQRERELEIKELQLGNDGVGSGVIDAISKALFFKMGSKTVRLKALKVEDVNASGVRLKAVERRFHRLKALGAFLIVS